MTTLSEKAIFSIMQILQEEERDIQALENQPKQDQFKDELIDDIQALENQVKSADKLNKSLRDQLRQKDENQEIMTNQITGLNAIIKVRDQSVESLLHTTSVLKAYYAEQKEKLIVLGKENAQWRDDVCILENELMDKKSIPDNQILRMEKALTKILGSTSYMQTILTQAKSK
jgi:hypothetical protein